MQTQQDLPYPTAAAVARGIPADCEHLADILDAELNSDGTDLADTEDTLESAARQALWRSSEASERLRADLMDADPRLRLLGDLVDRRAALDAEIRRLLCLYREWAQPAYPLSTLAAISRGSTAGVRTAYTDETRHDVEDLTGCPPRSSRDPQRPAWKPGDHPDGLYLGAGLDNNPVVISRDTGIAIIADPDRRATRTLQRLLTHQIVHHQLADWIRPAPAGDARNPDTGEGFAVLARLIPGTPQLYGPVTDTFTRNGQRYPIADFIPTFASHDQLTIAHIARSATPAPPPQRAILIGDLQAAGSDWTGQIPIITAPQRAHQWAWTLAPTSGAPTTFRLAAPDITGVTQLIDNIAGQVSDPDAAAALAGLLRLLVS